MLKFFTGGAPAPRPPVNSSNSKRPADRNVTTRPITPPSTPSSQFDEKVGFEIIADHSIASIPSTAARMTELLDSALPRIQKLHAHARTPDAFAAHEGEIKSAVKLVQMIQHQDGLHTARVAEALGTVQTVVERLAASTDSLRRVNNMMGELESARKNLYDSLPANIYEANDNECVGGVQIAGEVGGEGVQGRVIMAACRNIVKEGGLQVNAPVRGNNAGDVLVKLLELSKRP